MYCVNIRKLNNSNGKRQATYNTISVFHYTHTYLPPHPTTSYTTANSRVSVSSTIAHEPFTLTLVPHTLSLVPHTLTLVPHTLTLVPHTLTLVPHTLTLVPHTLTLVPHTHTLAPHTLTLAPHTLTLVLHTLTLVPHTLSLIPHTLTLVPHTLTLVPHTLTLAPPTLTLAPHTLTLVPHTLTLVPHTGTSLDPLWSALLMMVVCSALSSPVLSAFRHTSSAKRMSSSPVPCWRSKAIQYRSLCTPYWYTEISMPDCGLAEFRIRQVLFYDKEVCA